MRIPNATYRLQFNAQFGFGQTAEIVPYLKDLGISDIYASPIFSAVPGSLHGYDICNPDILNPELGTAEDFEALLQELKQADMGWIQDIVPNHMAYHSCNRRLMDILENDESFYRIFFDIDWNHPTLQGKVSAPFLGRHYSQCLEENEISLLYSEQGLWIRYYNLTFPLRLESYYEILHPRESDLDEAEEEIRQDYLDLTSVLKQSAENGISDSMDRTDLFKQNLWNLYSSRPSIRAFIDSRICPFQMPEKSAEVLARLDEIITSQRFNLSFWKNADSEINYRRFFSINGLIGLNAEAEAVFLDTHSLILKLVHKGYFTGLRIDHIDGLFDPVQYLKRLRDSAEDLYIVVEKILETYEELPSHWPVQGTTGYDFLNRLNGLFCVIQNENAFTRIYQNVTGKTVSFRALLREKRNFMLAKHMAGELDNHTRSIQNAARRTRAGRDFTTHQLKRALAAFLTEFPVYRSYVTQLLMTDSDRNYLLTAFEEARLQNLDLEEELRFFQMKILQQGDSCPVELDLSEKSRWISLLMKLQQIMGTLMAKGMEDTAFYSYNRMISLNEVGGSPGRFGFSPETFHHFMQTRMGIRPHSLNATSTHDTKRGEDARMRLNVLSELPDEWEENVRQWMKISRQGKRKAQDGMIPDPNTEYFLFQTLVGHYPFMESDLPAFADRLKDYMLKAVREAKENTSWSAPDRIYEEGMMRFIDFILEPSAANHFLPIFVPFQQKVAWYGMIHSLSQVLIKITAPGVPDFYQGTEFWDLSFVDPDNRRPVDFDTRITTLSRIKKSANENLPGLIQSLLSDPRNGAIKLFLIWRAIRTRNRRKKLFAEGSYHPVSVEGIHKEHILAFRRSEGESSAITIAPRFMTSIIAEGEYPLGEAVWKDTAILVDADCEWLEGITGETITSSHKRILITDILKQFPAGLLLKGEGL